MPRPTLRAPRRRLLATALLLTAGATAAQEPPSSEPPPERPADAREEDSATPPPPPPQEPGADQPPAAAFGDEIVVTATAAEERLVETPAAVTVLGEAELAAAAALSLDDALRQVPGFSLFRRTGSRTANPTTQGASLRGLGGSGAGRALVLADGIPLADPFGGWVSWGRLPRAAVERVEVLGGGASDLYGGAALAGVVHLLRREAAAGETVADVSAGSQETAAASLWTSGRRGRWAGAVAAEALTTEGHVPVAEAERGPVDRPAGTRHGALELTVERLAEESGGGPALRLRAGLFDEERSNGTAVQENATRAGHGSLGADWSLVGRGAGSLALRAWAADHRLDQTFSAVADDRASERLVREQRVPSTLLGGSARWRTAAGSRHTVTAGLEAERREGVSEERIVLPDRVIPTEAGGEQDAVSLMAQDVVALGARATLVAGLRYDRWENRPRDPADGAGSEAAERAEDMLSPRLAVRWQAAADLGLMASAYRSFRPPTLNELYRGFRVGDVVTDPNPELAAERLTGAEAGAVWTPRASRGRLRLRGTLFWMRLDDPVANVTLGIEDGLIRRQRRNLGRTRSRGVELEGEARLAARWHLGLAGLWTDAEVVDFPADPSLEGLAVPQVPRAQASAQVLWQGTRAGAALQARWADEQFDDDRNRFPLEELLLVDLRAGWRLAGGLELYAAAENLLDEEVTVGRTPVRTVGSPRLLRLGLRWRRAARDGIGDEPSDQRTGRS